MGAQYTATVFPDNQNYTVADIGRLTARFHSMPMGYPENIAHFRKRAKLTQGALAEKVGVEQPTIGRWEAGNREPTLSMLEKLADVFDIEVADLVATDAFRPLGPKLFVKGEVQAGAWREAYEWHQEEWTAFTGRADVVADEHHRFGLRVIGESMNLRYPPGSIVECVSVFGHAEPLPGKRVVVLRRREDLLYEATVKRLMEIDGALWLVPESTNPTFEAFRLDQPETGIIEVRIIAVVVGAQIVEE